MPFRGVELFLYPLGNLILERSNKLSLGPVNVAGKKADKLWVTETFFRSLFHKIFSSRQLILQVCYELPLLSLNIRQG